MKNGALSHSTIVVGIIYSAELAVLAVIATVVLINQWRRSRRDDDSDAVRYSNPAILGYATAYLAVMSILWAMSLPAYFRAVNGLTPNGDPTGSLWYTIGCLIVAGLSIAAAGTVVTRRSHPLGALSSMRTQAPSLPVKP